MTKTTLHNRIDKSFENSDSKICIMPFVEAGLPSMKTTQETILACEEAGATLIELGIPFSDPLADGPTIQLASEIALKKGATLEGSLNMLAKLRKKSEIPVVIFSYYNPIFAMGIKNFIKKAKAAGADGVLVPDMPLEESIEFQQALAKAGIHFIYLISLTSTTERIKAICDQASGFLYLVSVLGVTGARSKMSDSITSFVKRVRRCTKLPLTIGFGISTPAHVKRIANIADGAIVGSALAEKMMKSKPGQEAKNAKKYIRSLQV